MVSHDTTDIFVTGMSYLEPCMRQFCRSSILPTLQLAIHTRYDLGRTISTRARVRPK